jgi:hypothetical protein
MGGSSIIAFLDQFQINRKASMSLKSLRSVNVSETFSTK